MRQLFFLPTRFCAISHSFDSTQVEKEHAVSTTCTAAWKSKCHQMGSVTKVTQTVWSSRSLQTQAIKYLQGTSDSGFVLCGELFRSLSTDV